MGLACQESTPTDQKSSAATLDTLVFEQRLKPQNLRKPPAKQGAKAKRLYLPVEEESNQFDLSGLGHVSDRAEWGAPLAAARHGAQQSCSLDMVLVGAEFCIDRYEAHLVDAQAGRWLSPHYPPARDSTALLLARWTKSAPRSGRQMGRDLAVPAPPDFQLLEDFRPRAENERGVLPAGYLNRGQAETACASAGKRLCTRDEWVRACRGEQGTRFPYGENYREGACNVHRKHHPARLLHGDSSRHHLDPRLGLASDEDGPLLRRTGETEQCASRWGSDAIYDMVGNLDEWVADPSGAFLGGFYSRATKAGCDASIDSHSPGYFDYSLGTRCCADLAH